MSDNINVDLIPSTVRRSYSAFLELSTKQGNERSRAVDRMAKALKKNIQSILECNTLDLESGRETAESDLILEWLKLTPERIESTVEILERIAELPDPLQQVMDATYQLNPSQTYCQRMPLGVIALVYESFPELAAIAAGLCLKSGNSIILRGNSASHHSNTIIAQILRSAIEESKLPIHCLELLPTDKGLSIKELVSQDQYINLVIPYGRPGLINDVVRQATAPVLKTAMGNCYLYWADSGDLNLTRSMILDSHASEPDPVNAIEKVLINRRHNNQELAHLFRSLIDNGFVLCGDSEIVDEFSDYSIYPVEESHWQSSYLSRTVAFKMVDDLKEAIDQINRYSSGHADCLVTESYQESRQFAMDVDSALVYINTSPRFVRNPPQGDSIFLGISNQKGYRRGLIGLDTLTTVKQVVQGMNWDLG